ncbi:MAG: hypothetical protein WBF93_17430 [Pirellulales bacterium]|nr:hypothetical protein [Pirellulales bacterium]
MSKSRNRDLSLCGAAIVCSALLIAPPAEANTIRLPLVRSPVESLIQPMSNLSRTQSRFESPTTLLSEPLIASARDLLARTLAAEARGGKPGLVADVLQADLERYLVNNSKDWTINDLAWQSNVVSSSLLVSSEVRMTWASVMDDFAFHSFGRDLTAALDRHNGTTGTTARTSRRPSKLVKQVSKRDSVGRHPGASERRADASHPHQEASVVTTPPVRYAAVCGTGLLGLLGLVFAGFRPAAVVNRVRQLATRASNEQHRRGDVCENLIFGNRRLARSPATTARTRPRTAQRDRWLVASQRDLFHGHR